MSTLTDSIDEMVARRRPGYSLEQEFYTDPAIFDLDVERIFMRNWLYAGHVSRIAAPGDYFLFEVAGESIIIIRGSGGEVNALFNVCRHRGSRICLEGQGSVKRLVCPYHAWVYDTNGALIAARHMADDFERDQFGLHRCHVRVVEGLIFICAAAQPPDFTAIEADLQRFFAPYELADTRTATLLRHVVEANWKLVAENFFECYHCGHTHPEFCSVMSYGRAIDSPRLADEQAAFVAEWEAEMERRGYLTGHVEVSDERVHQCHRVPIRRGYLTQSEDGQPVAPLLGQLTEYDGGVSSAQLYPNIWFVACSDHAMLARFTPLSPTRTEAEFSWMVRGDAREGHDYDPERVSWLWRTTAAEDWAICEDNQRGVNSRRYQPGPYSRVEGSVDALLEWYLRQLSLYRPMSM